MAQKRFPINRSEQLEMWARWNAGDRSVGTYFFEKYRPAIYRFANIAKRAAPHIQLDDLLQAARIGVIVALDKFDPGRGMGSLPTVMKIYIQNEVFTYLHKNRSGAFSTADSKPERRMLIKGSEAVAAEEDLGFFGYEAITRAAQKLEVSASDLEKAMHIRHMDSRITFPGTDDEVGNGFSGEEVLGGEGTLSSEAAATRASHGALLETLFKEAGITSRERYILFSRYADEFRSLESIATDLCVSRERARRVEIEALDKLRAAAEKRGLDLSTLL